MKPKTTRQGRKKPTYKVLMNFKFDQDLIDAMKARCEQQGRTYTKFTEIALKALLASKG